MTGERKRDRWQVRKKIRKRGKKGDGETGRGKKEIPKRAIRGKTETRRCES